MGRAAEGLVVMGREKRRCGGRKEREGANPALGRKEGGKVEVQAWIDREVRKVMERCRILSPLGGVCQSRLPSPPLLLVLLVVTSVNGTGACDPLPPLDEYAIDVTVSVCDEGPSRSVQSPSARVGVRPGEDGRREEEEGGERFMVMLEAAIGGEKEGGGRGERKRRAKAYKEKEKKVEWTDWCSCILSEWVIERRAPISSIRRRVCANKRAEKVSFD